MTVRADSAGPLRFWVGAFGVRVEVVAAPPAGAVLASLLAGLSLGPGRVSAVLSLASGADGWSLREGAGPPLAESPDWHAPGEALLVRLNALLLAAAPLLAVHAGVVRLPGGGVLAMPAESGTGKSTMTAALVQAGAAYVSDEALVLDRGLVVTAYPRPLLLAADRASALGLGVSVLRAAEVAYPPASLGPAVTAGEPLRLRHVVRLLRRPGPVSLARLPGLDSAPLVLEDAFIHFED
ncbi:MAG: hypothetical protein H7233_02880, partial [Pseudorhodobacter sp.]|nr:hypothetical protein [Frankiaceae bacterium]